MGIIVTAIIAVAVVVFTWIVAHYSYKCKIQESDDRVEYLRAAYRETDRKAQDFHKLLLKLLEKEKGIVIDQNNNVTQ